MDRRVLLLAGVAAPFGFAIPAQAQLSEGEAARAVREALQIAAERSAARLGRPGGFFSDPRVHIPLPSPLRQPQRALRPLGLSGPLDDLEQRVNRAAENGMPEARAILLSVIRSFTIADALSIVRGGDTGATDFLRRRTTPRLSSMLTPHVERELADVGAFAQLDRAARSSGLGGGAGSSLRGQIVEFTVTSALNGLFTYIGEEERAIRADPLRRSSSLLRRVFGGGA